MSFLKKGSTPSAAISSGGRAAGAAAASSTLTDFYSRPPASSSSSDGGGSSAAATAQAQRREAAAFERSLQKQPDISHASSASANETFQPARKPARSAQDVLNELDERYMHEDFDPVKELFHNLPEDGEDHLNTRLDELVLVQSTIDKKLSSQVFKNYHHFVSGLALITEISEELKQSRNQCSNGREQLQRVDEALTYAILKTLQKQRSMTRCKVVILRLHEVYDLLRRENEINALLQRDEFIKSVSIYKKCLKKLAQSGLNKFTCLDALRARFLRTAELISNQVKGRLLSLAKRFNPDAFRNLIQAMVNLGDYKVLTEYLRKFITVAVEENACEAITPYLMREYLQSLLSMQASQGLAKAIEEAQNPEQRGNGVAVQQTQEKSNGVISLPGTPANASASAASAASSQEAISAALSSPSALTPAIIASLPRKPFHDLCRHLDLKQFTLAFLTLASHLTENLFAVQSMIVILGDIAAEERKKGELARGAEAVTFSPIEQERKEEQQQQEDLNETGGSESYAHQMTEAESISASLDSALAYLTSSRGHVWETIGTCVREFFAGSQLSVAEIGVEDFVRVLKNGRELVEIGDRFAKGGVISAPSNANGNGTSSSSSTNGIVSTSANLRTVLNTKSADFIRNFLRESLTSISTSFSTETFRPLLVEENFTPQEHIKEFRALKLAMERRGEKKKEDGLTVNPRQISDGLSAGASALDDESLSLLYDGFLSGANPFSRAILDQMHENALREREAKLKMEREKAEKEERERQSTRPPLRSPGSGPVRSAQLQLSLGRPNFALPTVGGMTGGVPTVQPRAQAQAQARAEAAAAAAGGAQVAMTPGGRASFSGGQAALLPAGASSSLPATAESPSRPFILQSTLTLLKTLGKYLSLMHRFPSQSLDALSGLQDCLEVWVYTLTMQMGYEPRGFFEGRAGGNSDTRGSASTVGEGKGVHAELNPSMASPTYLLEAYPTLRALLQSVKNRVELGQFGGGPNSVTAAAVQALNGPSRQAQSSTAWAREWRQEDVMAAASALAQAQAAWSDSHSGSTALSTNPSLLSPTSGTPLTLASAASAQASAASQIEKKAEKDSFFSKLKEKMSSVNTPTEKERAQREAQARGDGAGAGGQTGGLNAVAHAAQMLAAASASHPPPNLIALSAAITRALDSPDALHGLAHRANAAESLGFVFAVLEEQMETLSELLPQTPAAVKRLYQFRAYVDSLSRELPEYLFYSCAPILLPKEAFLSKLNGCRWDLKDLETKYNAYVDTIMNTLRVNHMSLHSSSTLAAPLLRKLSSSLLRYLTAHLVEAYAKAKKCTTEGRGLMTLDLSALRSGLEKLTNIKPLPHWEFVLGWVNAYYLQENDFLTWVSAHPEYTMVQILSIAQTGCGASKPSKERLVLIGNVTNAHVAAVDKARKERDEAIRRKRAAPGLNISADLAAAAAENAGTPAMSVTSTASTSTPLPVSTPLPISLPIAFTTGSRPSSRPPSKPVSRQQSRTASPALTPSSSATNLASLALSALAPNSNGAAAIASSSNGHAAGSFQASLDKLEESDSLP